MCEWGERGGGVGALIASKSGKVQPKKPNNNNKTLLIKIKIYRPLCMTYKENIYNTQQHKVHCNTAVHRHIYATSFT